MFENNYEKKTEEIRFRCTKEEKELVSKVAKGLNISVSSFVKKSISTNLRIYQIFIELNDKYRNNSNFKEIIQLLEELQNGISDSLEKTLKKIDDINSKINHNHDLGEVPDLELKLEDDTEEVSLNDLTNNNF
ncbi:MAG: hypothetical protein E6469_12865 [Clostridium perfringens]|uniref:plasmid mobilization protein n=1 Tax=Clostridium perfringens TaxID=1502 RepID=UPI0012424E92|nr:hypothetical protein [Clostridium perfringens]MCX0354742.1 hypothetical protein [Clostridium perfringens]MDB2047308.1 hypothetical protein [Clostridium perfringens]MDB2058894.1 hypothetical protein [Clostridium perfringens]MDK0812068.1 hypothetical protein [Clostridium perfringens]MDU6691693.1 hypothetical protein [Clostridium perfringens]